jgi:hypothetical protein
MLSTTFSDNILTRVCFTSHKFDTIEGITTANFDKPHEQLVSNPPKSTDELMEQVGASPKMRLLRARYNYRTGGLFYTQNRHPMPTTLVKSACNAVIAISLRR